MSLQVFDWESFERLPVVGILRGFERTEVLKAVAVAADGGICNFEVTMNTSGAEELIRALSESVGSRANVGAGTVCSMADLEAALRAGASFIVTPTLRREVIQSCVRRQIPVFPGAMSPTEIHTALAWGAPMVKVFPSEVLGPGFLQALRGPFPEWKLMPTGGVTVESLPDYKRAGAAAFGVGSPLFNKAQVKAGNWDWVKLQAQRFRVAFEAK